MKPILFGATGMVGSGTLREALADPGVEAVLGGGRRRCVVEHPKPRELLLPTFSTSPPGVQRTPEPAGIAEAGKRIIKTRWSSREQA